MIIAVIVAYLILIIYELIPIYKKNHMKDFWINVILQVISFSIAAFLSFDIKIPSPALPIQNAIKSIIGR